jgi:hypothetical protein
MDLEDLLSLFPSKVDLFLQHFAFELYEEQATL